MVDATTPKLSLSMKARDLKKSDQLPQANTFCKAFLLNADNIPIEQGSTEICEDNPNPDWCNDIEVPFYFELPQQLKFTVYNYSEENSFEIGSVIVPMSCLAGKKTVNIDLELRDELKGLLMISSEEITNSNDFYMLQFSAQDLVPKEIELSHVFMTIQRIKPGRDHIRVHKSQYIQAGNEIVWPAFDIRTQHLCGNQDRAPLRFEIYNHIPGTRRSVLLGSGFTTLNDIREKKSITLNDKNVKTGLISVVGCSLHTQRAEVNTFLDYLRGGTQVNVIVAIDFTASNGNSHNPKSLHYISPGRQNEYEQAIISVCSILEAYDSDKMYPVFGFGGIFEENSDVDHCYPLNRNRSNPEVQGVAGILDIYKDAVRRTTLNAPTNLEPVLRKVKEIAESTQPGEAYYVLLILTDGDITDMEETKRAIIDASNLPLSIVIVGIGSDNFENMIELDGDQIPLRDSDGRITARDIVQFVPFRKYKDNIAELASEVLNEVPAQVEGFMNSQGIVPSIRE